MIAEPKKLIRILGLDNDLTCGAITNLVLPDRYNIFEHSLWYKDALEKFNLRFIKYMVEDPTHAAIVWNYCKHALDQGRLQN